MRKEKVRIVYMATSEMEASVRKNDVKTVGELLKKHGYKMFEDMELLHKAVNDLNFEMVRALVENGWDINQTNECEENVMFDIMCFIENDQIKMYLIEKEINVHQVAWDGETLLMKAVDNDEYELGEVFVSRGVDLTIKNEDGDTVFDLLVEDNKRKWINIFIKNQENLDPESLQLLQKKRMEFLFA